MSLFREQKLITFWTSTFTQGNCLCDQKAQNQLVINKWTDREYVQEESWKWFLLPPGTACVPFISFNRIYYVHSKLD